ncbi:MAG: tryptophan--tRNA ligase [Candidatus Micrarchaeota archaeon]|nr:tryptophan--tRNA ligase [Candidatus Micrarchaeota archaeon]
MAVTAWEVEGDIDYAKMIKQFGTQPMTESLAGRLKKPLPNFIRRGALFSHRDLDKWLAAAESGKKITILTGRGPSNKMHIGHLLLYELAKYFQDAYGCRVYIPVSDDEKFFVKEGLSVEDVEKVAHDNIIDILAMGFDPKNTLVFMDFKYTKIYRHAAEVAKHMTYSMAKATFGLKPEQNVGWSFYPAMQSAHVMFPQFMEGAHNVLVPIGIDQDPFLRLTRDLTDRFKFIKPSTVYPIFLPSLSGSKMSSSAKDSDTTVIWLADDEKAVSQKIRKYAFSGGRASIEEHRKMGGNPDIDVSFQYLKYFFEDDDKKLKGMEESYKSGSLLTGELKEYLIAKINSYLKGHAKRRQDVERNLDKYMLED